MSGNQKRAGAVILISDKIDFKPQMVTSSKEGHLAMIKRSIHQEDITIISTNVPNIGVPEYIKQIPTIVREKHIVEDFNIHFE